MLLVAGAVREIVSEGKFNALAGTMPNAELNEFFREDAKTRRN